MHTHAAENARMKGVYAAEAGATHYTLSILHAVSILHTAHYLYYTRYKH